MSISEYKYLKYRELINTRDRNVLFADINSWIEYNYYYQNIYPQGSIDWGKIRKLLIYDVCNNDHENIVDSTDSMVINNDNETKNIVVQDNNEAKNKIVQDNNGTKNKMTYNYLPRLSASNMGIAIGHSSFKTSTMLAFETLNICKTYLTEPEKIVMNNGTKYESVARDIFIREILDPMCNNRWTYDVEEVGLAVPKWNHQLSGSPDGIIIRYPPFSHSCINSSCIGTTSCIENPHPSSHSCIGTPSYTTSSSCIENLYPCTICSNTDTSKQSSEERIGLIEIKSVKKMYTNIIHYMKNYQTLKRDPYYHAHIWDTHYDQMQTCMAIYNLPYCYYIVYSYGENKIFYDKVLFNEKYWDEVIYPGAIDYINVRLNPLYTNVYDNGLSSICSPGARI